MMRFTISMHEIEPKALKFVYHSDLSLDSIEVIRIEVSHISSRFSGLYRVREVSVAVLAGNM